MHVHKVMLPFRTCAHWGRYSLVHTSKENYAHDFLQEKPKFEMSIAAC